jgi:hypothetical protein
MRPMKNKTGDLETGPESRFGKGSELKNNLNKRVNRKLLRKHEKDVERTKTRRLRKNDDNTRIISQNQKKDRRIYMVFENRRIFPKFYPSSG